MPSPRSSANTLVDTNVITELTRARPNRGILDWAGTVGLVALSVITVEEVFFGLAWKPNQRVRSWFESFVGSRCEVLPVTSEIAKGAGQMRGILRSMGHTATRADMLITSTAQHHQLTLVTRNVRDFADCGIALLNPFK